VLAKGRIIQVNVKNNLCSCASSQPTVFSSPFFFFSCPEKFRAQISIAVNPPGHPLVTNFVKHYMKRVKQLVVSEANHLETNVFSISFVRLMSGISDLILQHAGVYREINLFIPDFSFFCLM